MVAVTYGRWRTDIKLIVGKLSNPTSAAQGQCHHQQMSGSSREPKELEQEGLNTSETLSLLSCMGQKHTRSGAVAPVATACVPPHHPPRSVRGP